MAVAVRNHSILGFTVHRCVFYHPDLRKWALVSCSLGNSLRKEI